MKYYIDVNKIIKAIRKKDGVEINQVRLANLLNVSEQTVSNWKYKGHTKVIVTLLKIIQLSGLKLNQFISKR